jgi:hypothetical protein
MCPENMTDFNVIQSRLEQRFHGDPFAVNNNESALLQAPDHE